MCLNKLLACPIANHQEEIRYVLEIDNENSFFIIYIFLSNEIKDVYIFLFLIS